LLLRCREFAFHLVDVVDDNVDVATVGMVNARATGIRNDKAVVVVAVVVITTTMVRISMEAETAVIIIVTVSGSQLTDGSTIICISSSSFFVGTLCLESNYPSNNFAMFNNNM
jgi:hypothetical protein